MWSIRTKVFLQAQGHYIWLSVVTGYDSSKMDKTATKKELRKNNKIAMDFIWEGLLNPLREKVGKFSSAKELWDKLHDIYSSPITYSENVKEDADTNQKELCSPCQADSEDEEYIITRGMLFCVNCEKCGHLEIECHEGNETEKLIEKEDNYEEELKRRKQFTQERIDETKGKCSHFLRSPIGHRELKKSARRSQKDRRKS
jgi:hypothetical protein